MNVYKDAAKIRIFLILSSIFVEFLFIIKKKAGSQFK